jgi:hypothetical protein
MPYKSQKIKIENTKFDRRIKLNEEDKKCIYNLYHKENFSQRNLAKIYNVSRRTISFIVNPESLNRHKELSKNRNYYNKDSNREYIKNHRRYKQELFKSGKIDDK